MKPQPFSINYEKLRLGFCLRIIEGRLVCGQMTLVLYRVRVVPEESTQAESSARVR
jgi:hypothetical protein